jgi:general stress protein 26
MLSRGATAERVGDAGVAANLAFSDERRAAYVSVTGRATLVDDAARKRELWSAVVRPWFPGGAEDPELVLLKLQPEHAELWDGPRSRTVRALALATSALQR